MKKIIISGSFTFLLLACNNHSDNNGNTLDTSNHIDHQKNKNDMNPITETMDRMMHEMHRAGGIGNNDIDFATMMIEHHKGAVEMSKIELERGKDEDLKKFAQQVINDQNKEIAQMEQIILNAPKDRSKNTAEFQKALNHSMMAMMNDNTQVYNNIDKDFAAQMIPHHQSAVDMAKVYLQFGKDISLRKLCESIITSQSKEIQWLKGWLTKPLGS
jgi:uncharacterized protein (DUF305 family)